MQKSISLKRAIQTAILLLMMLAIVLVWPAKLITGWQYEGELDEESYSVIEHNGFFLQQFVPQAEGLTYISLYLYNEEFVDGDILVFRLYDENLRKIENKDIHLDKLSFPGICKIRIGSELEAGGIYYFSIQNIGTELLLSMENEAVLDTRYEYKVPFTARQCAVRAAFILLCGAVLLLFTGLLLRRNKRFIKADFGLRLALGLIASGIAVWAALSVYPGRKFSNSWIDILFYLAGICFFLFFSLYGLFYKRTVPQEGRFTLQGIRAGVPGVLQSLAFAGVMLGCVRYVNALNSYQQKLASNTALLSFALVIICGYAAKEIWNWYNLIYMVPATGLGIYYCLQNNDHIEHWNVAKGSAAVVVLWGIVILNTLRLLIKNRIKKVSWVYMAALLLLFAEMIRSRNTRTWPIEIAVFWGLFAIRVIYTGKVKEYLYRFSNGVFIHFIGISIYAMLYRPFHYYYYTRYSGVFHTVTMTAVYTVLVLLLAMVRFLAVYKKEGCLKKAWKEVWLMGMAAAFLLLTLSRTGLVAAAILCPLLLLVTTVTEFRDGIKGALKRTGITIGICACFFVMIFTACRIVPAVVSKPFTYEIEWFMGSVKPGEAWDSPWFVTVSRFFGVAEAKISYYSEEGIGAENVLPEGEEGSGNPVQSAQQVTDELAAMGASTDYSNGRMDIYRAYLKALNWKGHDTLSLKTEDGQDIMHAHNSFIQTAYDFGIGAGVYFLIFCIFAGIKSIFYYWRNREESTALAPVTILAAFGICGMVERVFFPYIALGFAFLFILVLLIPAENKEEADREQRKG